MLGGMSVHGSCNVENSYNKPDLVLAKGCGKRFKGGKETALAKAKIEKLDVAMGVVKWVKHMIKEIVRHLLICK